MSKVYQREAFITKGQKEGTFTFQASSEKVDSYGDVVVQRGIDLTRFKENPIILYQHSADEPIGKAIDIRLEEKGIVADIELAPKGISEKIDTIRGLLEAGILKAVSIGFTAQEYEPIRNEDNQFTGYKFLKSLLHEISIVSIPANDEALAIARSFKLSQDDTRLMFKGTDDVNRQIQNKNRVRLLQIQNGNKSHD